MQKYIIQSYHRIFKFIIENIHRRMIYAGVNNVLTELCERFWIKEVVRLLNATSKTNLFVKGFGHLNLHCLLKEINLFIRLIMLGSLLPVRFFDTKKKFKSKVYLALFFLQLIAAGILYLLWAVTVL